MLPVMAAAVALVDVKDILPVPLAPNPIAVFVFVQLYTVPVTAPVKLAMVLAPIHTVWFACATTVGVGLTVMVNVVGVPTQLTPVYNCCISEEVKARFQMPTSSILPFHLSYEGAALAPIVNGLP